MCATVLLVSAFVALQQTSIGSRVGNQTRGRIMVTMATYMRQKIKASHMDSDSPKATSSGVVSISVLELLSSRGTRITSVSSLKISIQRKWTECEKESHFAILD